MNWDTNKSIAKIQETCNAYYLLRDAIFNEHRFYFESMKLDQTDEEFMRFYGGYCCSLILVEHSGQCYKKLSLTPEMQEKVEGFNN